MEIRDSTTQQLVTALHRIRFAAAGALSSAEEAVGYLRDLEYDAGSAGPYVDNPALVGCTMRSDYGNALAALADAQRQLAYAASPVELLADSTPVNWAGRTFGQLTPAEKRAAARAAFRKLSAEMAANADAISAAMNMNIPHEMNVTISELIEIAASLTEARTRGPRDSNPEYERALCELISDAARLPGQDGGKEAIAAAIGLSAEES